MAKSIVTNHREKFGMTGIVAPAKAGIMRHRELPLRITAHGFSHGWKEGKPLNNQL
jgi:hypothetical protein